MKHKISPAFFSMIFLLLVTFFACSDDENDLLIQTDILTFSFAEQTGEADIDNVTHTISIEVDTGTDLSSLSPTFTLSEGAKASYISGATSDFSRIVIIRVTAESGSFQDWKIVVAEAASNATDIHSFTLPEQTGDAVINAETHTIDIEVAAGADLTKLTPTFTLSEGASSDPASGTEGDYSSEVTIAVTAEDGATKQDWTVNVTKKSSSENDILTITLDGQTGPAVIDNVAHTIDIEVFNAIDLGHLAPDYTVSAGATADPPTRTYGDFNSAYIITVTAEDGTVQDWEVRVAHEGSNCVDATATVVFADGEPPKATGIQNLVVDGVTYDVEFLLEEPDKIYGDYPGVVTFSTVAEAIEAINIVNIALDCAHANEVGQISYQGAGRFRVGFESHEVSGFKFMKFIVGFYENDKVSWETLGVPQDADYLNESGYWAKFTKK